MYVTTNIATLHAGLVIEKQGNDIRKTLEKVSSGLRVNRAADDAAGLGVSEKMRALIRGLSTACENAKNGLALVNIGEGSISEVHEMLRRMKELAAQSANGVYVDEHDRAALQQEFSELCADIDRVVGSTNYNGIPLFQNVGLQREMPTAAELHRLMDVLSDDAPGTLNVIYTNTTYITPRARAAANGAALQNREADAQDMLQTQVIPAALQKILTAYPAAASVLGPNIGIALYLYEDDSTALACGLNSGVVASYEMQTYQLCINMNSIELSTADGREKLKNVVVHQIMHTVMSKAVTSGASGVTNAGASPLPAWFEEGMAQAVNGPGNWLDVMGLSDGQSVTEIQSSLAGFPLTADTSVSEYGTGYLACMYLGYLAGGTGLSMPAIADGLNEILTQVSGGQSINDIVFALTAGRYSGLDDFAAGFAADIRPAEFVWDLNDANQLRAGAQNGADGSMPALQLFRLNADQEIVESLDTNSSHLSGIDTAGYLAAAPDADSNVLAAAATGRSGVMAAAVSYPNDLFTVTGAANGWEYDAATGVLTIKKAGNFVISGGMGIDAASNLVSGQIVIADNIGAVNIQLDGVQIDQSANKKKAAFETGTGNTVTVELKGSNVLASGEEKAGLYVNAGSNLILDGPGSLTARGGVGPASGSSKGGAGIGAGLFDAGGNITINGGIINAYGGMGGAGIGGAGRDSAYGASNGTIGNITINGGKVTASSKGHGAGIGGGWRTSNKTITINGGDITATSLNHGTGIGTRKGEILVVPQFYFSVEALGLGGMDISTQENAWNTMPAISSAINRVSAIRGTYGALQNRLEHITAALDVSGENLTAAESRIRDADMAKEMTQFTKQSVMMQAAQAMLSHANTEFERVLELLK